MGFHSTHGLQVEPVDDGWLILMTGRSDLLHLTGIEAEAFDLARAGCTEVPDDLTVAMAGLVELGVVQTDTWSRRRVMQLGGAAAAAAVAVVALPSVAAASSPPGGGTAPSTTSSTSTTIPVPVAPDIYVADIGHDGVVKIDGDTGAQEILVLDLGVPYGVAVESDGSLLVADHSNDQVLRFPPGNGLGDDVHAPSLGGMPYGVAVGVDGNIYVTCQYREDVLVYDAAADTWGSIGSGLGAPRGVAVDGDGNVYVADTGNSELVRIAAGTGDQSVLAGVAVPYGVAVGSDGNVYVTDFGGGQIVQYSPATGDSDEISYVFETRPTGIAAGADGKLYAVDDGSGFAHAYDIAAGTWETIGNGLLGASRGVAVG